MSETRGGARKRAGRKTELAPGEEVKQTPLMLDDMTKRMLVVLGGGNMSLGARRAARVAYDRYQLGK